MAKNTPILDIFNKIMKVYLNVDNLFFKDSPIIQLQYRYDASCCNPESIVVNTQMKEHIIFAEDINFFLMDVVVHETRINTLEDVINDGR